MSNIPLRTPRQVDLIVSSLRKVFETEDVSHLTNSAYKFLYLCSGFIAHTNLFGFRDRYANVSDLKIALIENDSANQWRNFHPGDQNYEYYMQEREIYNRILDLIGDGQEDESYTDPTGVNYIAPYSTLVFRS